MVVPQTEVLPWALERANEEGWVGIGMLYLDVNPGDAAWNGGLPSGCPRVGGWTWVSRPLTWQPYDHIRKTKFIVTYLFMWLLLYLARGLDITKPDETKLRPRL